MSDCPYLAALFGEFGLEVEASTMAWVSKVMVFRKTEATGGRSASGRGSLGVAAHVGVAELGVGELGDRDPAA
jgi:hypothetical protein